jgi:hypothetical protein
MRRLLAVLLLLSLLAGGSYASATPRFTLRDLVAWTGCTAEVVTSDAHGIEESFYLPEQHALYLGTAPAPSYVVLMVALHESAHCLQMQEGYLVPLWTAEGSVAVELDADRRAAEMACDLGLDGARLLHDVFAWLHSEFGYDGDGSHGTIEERISQADHALGCRNVPAQAPILTR